jgi:cobalt-zinc-cadmium efflux system outer membrane protein
LGTTVFFKGALLLLMPGILCLASSSPLRAEAEMPALSQVVKRSLQNNAELNSFREEKGIRDAGKTRAGLLPNPTFELDAATGALTGSSAENSLSLGVSQEFFLAGKREKRVAIAEQELELYRWQLADRERVLAEEVKTAFYDLALAEQRIIYVNRFIALNRQLLDVTNERLAAGDIPELEMNLVKVELARSEASRIDAEKTLYRNQTKLWSLMGVPNGESPVTSGTFDAELSMTRNLIDLKKLAHEKRPDQKALEVEKNRCESDVSLAQIDGIPNITAGLSIKRDTTATEVNGVENKETAYTIGVKLSIPIPLFDNNQAGVQEAKAKRSSSESRLFAIMKTVERDVESAYASFQNANKILDLYKTNIIPQLEENLKLTQESYRLGEVGILSLIQEQKKFFEVNEGYLTALHDRQIALVKLESAVATELTGGVQ